MKNNNHHANQKNANTGTSGTNQAYQSVLDNRSAQLNPVDHRYQVGKKQNNLHTQLSYEHIKRVLDSLA